MSELYNRIDLICKARGTNITAICKKAGVGRATLSELNAGRTKTLTLETAQKLADALEVSLNFLQGNFDDGEPIGFTVSVEEMREYLQKKEKAPTSKGERKMDLSPAFFRLKQGLAPYNLSEADADFLLDVYKAHIRKNSQE